MKVLGIIAVMFSTLCSYAQHEILNKEWIVKRVSVDTLLLSDKALENNSEIIKQYLEKPCEFQDTTYYWTFKRDSIDITRIIRSCSNGWKKNPEQKADNFKYVTNTLVLKHDSLSVNAEEVRLSLWEKSEGTYKIKKSKIDIRKTGKFEGRYRIQIIDSRRIKLILKRK